MASCAKDVHGRLQRVPFQRDLAVLVDGRVRLEVHVGFRVGGRRFRGVGSLLLDPDGRRRGAGLLLIAVRAEQQVVDDIVQDVVDDGMGL